MTIHPTATEPELERLYTDDLEAELLADKIANDTLVGGHGGRGEPGTARWWPMKHPPTENQSFCAPGTGAVPAHNTPSAQARPGRRHPDDPSSASGVPCPAATSKDAPRAADTGRGARPDLDERIG